MRSDAARRIQPLPGMARVRQHGNPVMEDMFMLMHTRRMRGVTLVEQIMVLAIVAVLIGSAIPSLRKPLQRNRETTTANKVVNALRTTRMLAINHRSLALLCPSSDGRHCSGDIQWQHGWLIGLDRNDDGQPDGPIVAVQQAIGGGIRILGSRGRRYVHYRPDGGAPGSNLSLLVCSEQAAGKSIHRVVVSNAGRVRMDKASADLCH